MTLRPLFSLLLLAVLAPAASAQEQLAQLTIHERVIIRVPRMSPPPARHAPAEQPVWKEKRGPKCIAVGDLAGALITTPSSVDLVLDGGKRLRARLDGDCRPLDFYSGFYLRPAPDGKVCADRDAIHARSGATCPITTFRRLEPVTPKR